MRESSFLLAASCWLLGSVGYATPTAADIRALTLESRCEAPSPGHVRFAGDISGLGPCLDRWDGPIAELRITSGGGGAWDALRAMQKHAGRIDLLVVERLCASSCANYVIPAARRLRVEPGSYVLLHGSPNLSDIDAQEASFREQFSRMTREQQPDVSDDQLGAMATSTWQSLRDEVARMRPVQAEWARSRLSCEDWLDPRRHSDGALPSGMAWLLVTPQMAKRCLNATRVSGFWRPERESAFARDLGFVRARR